MKKKKTRKYRFLSSFTQRQRRKVKVLCYLDCQHNRNCIKDYRWTMECCQVARCVSLERGLVLGMDVSDIVLTCLSYLKR